MRFLYVADDINIAQIYVEMIKDLMPEAQIDHFTNSSEALAELEKKPVEYRLIISDYLSDAVSGPDLFQFVNAQKLSIPFIILSSVDCKNDPKLRDFYNSELRNAIMQEPVSVLELVQKIKWCINGHTDSLISGHSLTTGQDQKVAIRSDTFSKMNIVPCDVFFKLRDGKFIKVINKNELFETQLIQRLIGRGIEQFYVHRTQLSSYGESMLITLHSLLKSKKYKNDDQKKSEITNQAMEILKSNLKMCGFSSSLLRVADDVTNLQLEMINDSPALATFLKKFQNFRKLDTEHSRLVSYVIVGILRELKWDSDSTLHRMCTAALLHDFSLPENFTQKICDRDNLKILEIEDLKTFHRHPEESAQIAKHFESIAPGIDQYILEHHELPNGEGFPKKYIHSGVHPLSVTLHLASYTADLLWKFDFDINKVKEHLDNDKPLYHKGFYRKPYEGLIRFLRTGKRPVA